MIRLGIIIGLCVMGAFAQSTLPETVTVTRIPGITSSDTVIDNRSAQYRQNNNHSIYCTGSDSWSAKLQYSSASTGPWSDLSDSVTQDSSIPIVSAVGYVPFLRVLVTGTASCMYNGVKNFFTSGGGTSAQVSVDYIDKVRNKPVYDVREFGARGDGTHDDTAAIQEAVASNRSVFIPCGTYKTTSDIDLSGYSNLTISGAGHCSIIDPAFNSGNVFKFSSGSNNIIRDLSIIGSTVSVPSGNRTSVYIADQFAFTAENLTIYYGSKGVHVSGGFEIKLTNVQVSSVAPSTGVSFQITGSASEVYLNDCLGAGTTGREPNIGLHVDSGLAVYVTNSQFIQHATGSWIGGGSADVKWVWFKTSGFDTNKGDGLHVEPSSGKAVYGINGEGLWFGTNGGNGFSASIALDGGGSPVATIDSISLSGTRSLNNMSHGFAVGNFVTNFSCTDCRAFGNSAVYGSGANYVTTSGTAVTRYGAASGQNGAFNGNLVAKSITINGVGYTVSSVTDSDHLTLSTSAGVQSLPVAWSSGSSGVYSGLFIAPNASHVRVLGGRYGQQENLSNTQSYGIVISSGGINDYLTITGADVSTNVTGGLFNGGTGNNNFIFGNLPASANAIPTSCAGKPALTIWNNSGTLQMCP